MTPANLANQFGDTTYTKVFVGGLAWETQRETMRKYFDQFGEILEAVVITDKNTGRSKGYGFVTFREAEAAMRACVDPSPVIDGRRANCNLASLGVQKSRPSTPKQGGGGGARSFRVMNSYQTGGGGVGAGFPYAAATATATTFPPYAIQQGIPYNVYGYSAYSPHYAYPASYYNVYGGVTATQYPVYGEQQWDGEWGHGGGLLSISPVQGGKRTTSPYTTGQGYSLQYPHHLYPYSALNSAGFAPHYGGAMPLGPTPPTPPGVTVAITAPTLHAPTPHPYRIIPTFTPAASEQPSA